MSDDRADEDEGGTADAAKPASAAARRERKAASARPTGRAGSSRPGEDSKGRATRARDGRQQTGSVLSRFVRFLREVVAELRKVIWPTRNQMITYTAVVVVFVIFMVAFVAGVDLAFARAVSYVFG